MCFSLLFNQSIFVDITFGRVRYRSLVDCQCEILNAQLHALCESTFTFLTYLLTYKVEI